MTSKENIEKLRKDIEMDMLDYNSLVIFDSIMQDLEILNNKSCNDDETIRLLIKKNINPLVFKEYMGRYGDSAVEIDKFRKFWNNLCRNKDEELDLVDFLLVRDRIKKLGENL